MPVAVLTGWLTDRTCFHLQGGVEAAIPGTPRAGWCSAVEPGHHWWPLAVVPVIACFALISLCSLWAPLATTRARIAITVTICALALLQAAHADELKAYSEF